MAQGTEPIRQDIDSIRDSMTDKISQIETRVRDRVDETLDTVKRTFDLKQQVSTRPWAAFGLAVLAGYALGSMGGDGDDYGYNEEYVTYYPQHAGEQRRSSHESAYYRESRGAAWSEQQRQGQSGFIGDVLGQFGGELDTIKTAAVAAAVNMLRDTIRQNLPRFQEEYERVRHQRDQTPSGQQHESLANEPSMREQAARGSEWHTGETSQHTSTPYS